MRKSMAYSLVRIGLMVGFGILMFGNTAAAQQSSGTPNQTDLYCSGVATDQAVPVDTYLISGEDSNHLAVFVQGNLVYINRGAEQGAKVGDEYLVIRAVSDTNPVQWFKWQSRLEKAMGTLYADLGRIVVVSVQPKVSVARVTFSCDVMQRGDIVLPFTARPAPAYHTAKLDPYAPSSGKTMGMIVTNKHFGQESEENSIVYVNLGSSQGVHVGDYFRVFRYQGTRTEALYQEPGTAYKMYGFGSTPVAYRWDNLPRQIVGEGIVLRTGPNSSTVQLTTVREQVYAGDYVEIE